MSYPNQPLCEDARQEKKDNLQTQIDDLSGILSSSCFQLFVGGFGSYYFPDQPGGIVVGGPFCGLGNTPVPGTNECVDDVVISGALTECNNALNVAQLDATDQINTLDAQKPVTPCSASSFCP